MDYNSLSGIDKCAILFQVLGEPLAVSFFAGFGLPILDHMAM